MSWSLALFTLLCASAVAYANGANDVSKGVATLVGAGVAPYRRALRFGMICTAAGSVAALTVSAGLVHTFSTALVDPRVVAAASFPLAVAAGTAGWVVIATVGGLPVSTTHAMAGGIVGAAVASEGIAAVHWALLAVTVGLPLAISPLASAVLAYGIVRLGAPRVQRVSDYCLCVTDPHVVASSSPASLMAATIVQPAALIVGSCEQCTTGGVSSLVRLTSVAHWVSAGVLSFARGLNDTPKIVGLGVLALPVVGQSRPAFFLTVAAVMTLGSYLFGRRVTVTLAEHTVRIDRVEGMVANGVAAALVLLASAAALPVSTTHVVGGAIVGGGLSRGRHAVHWATLRTILVAWLVTLPSSALIAGLVSAIT